MATILLAGDDAALLEGLAQLLASLGHTTAVARSLGEAREIAGPLAPLVAVMDHRLLDGMDTLGITLGAGGALVLFRDAATPPATLPANLRRMVLADLTLPLERNRLVTLVTRVEERAATVGRGRRDTPGPPMHR